MTQYRQLVKADGDRVVIPKLRWCDDFSSKLRGFTFRRSLPEDEGLVLVEKNDSRVKTGIHMLFVFMDLGVVWVNDAGEVVDQVVARPWRLSYMPQSPARYVVEVHPDILNELRVGDRVHFRPRPA
jgi:uncharacterized membrane protein (UPF0127 family)